MSKLTIEDKVDWRQKFVTKLYFEEIRKLIEEKRDICCYYSGSMEKTAMQTAYNEGTIKGLSEALTILSIEEEFLDEKK